MTGLHPCYSARCIWKKRLKSCQNVTTLNYILSCVGCFFFCWFFSSLGLFVVVVLVFFLANLSPVCMVIALFPYLLFWNKEKQHMAPELRTWPSFNLQKQLTNPNSCTTQRILAGYCNTRANVGTDDQMNVKNAARKSARGLWTLSCQTGVLQCPGGLQRARVKQSSTFSSFGMVHKSSFHGKKNSGYSMLRS